ncbi:hypothetical protein GCM10022267_25830 [Lentzea roselyniae]|uniref:Uncharacterized protein n=1 Tax=Lentzea roselyniae TaxID=531940 RepID=A0ABP7ARG9_9PSEU
MSTTPDRDDTAARPSLPEVLADWAERTPSAGAPVPELIAWFDLKVDLLQPIIHDPNHPDRDQARAFARTAKQNANALRDKENQR